ncbi:LytR family transcriptional regulator [Nocardioides oleivorans]|uniref:LytR family transcriptional regulator n=1 Tax=Nocardioides oleivorans TaxID=273676 RepID=A0A4Q2S3K7_9ACTN|nr:LCP family protein [Nocardioides oleivorans]RYB94703.1 LytR family transcriptional regulator [Nocardioides oleivorans]
MSDESRPETPDSAPKRKGKAKRKHTVGRVVLISALVLALITGLSTVYFIRHLNGNIEGVSTDALDEDARPEEVYTGNGEPLDILVMGSDSRDCDGCGIDQEGGGGSDTTILVHLSADRSRAYAVSIPRDSIVNRPEDGCDSPAVTDVIWNAAYSVGGPLCTMRQLEENTGIRVEHFIVVDFASFGSMVDAVGGVPVCVPEDIKDPKHSIFVPKGNPSVLTGDEALDYVRARYVGDLIQQNDISRIRRQQEFIGALVREVLSAGTLTRLDKVVRFLDAATKSLTTDDEFANVTRLGKVAMQLQGIGLDKIKFVTLPTAYYTRDSGFFGRVYWTEQADEIWKLIAQDKELPAKLIGGTSVSAEGPPGSSESPSAGESSTGTPSGTPSETPSETPTETPSETVTETPSGTPSTPTTPTETTDPEDRIYGVCA